MRAQPTVEGIDHVGRNGVVVESEDRAASAISPPTGETRTFRTEQIRIEPIRWSVIVAGAFAAFAALGVLGLLAAAFALPPFLPNSLRIDPAGSGLTFLVASIVSILAFGAGGWLASRLSIVRTIRTGLLCGALVWAVCVPLITAGVVAGRTTLAEVPAPRFFAANPGVGYPNADGTTMDPQLEMRIRQVALGEHIQRLGGVTFIALVLGFGAALGGGLLGAGYAVTSHAPRERPSRGAPAAGA